MHKWTLDVQESQQGEHFQEPFAFKTNFLQCLLICNEIASE
jgi:hypothetical protein